MNRALHLSPMVPTRDCASTMAFFRDILGFAVILEDGGYAVLENGPASVHLIPAGKDIGQMEMYLEVEDVGDIWPIMEPRVQHLNHKPPFDRPYGMREIHVDVPGTSCLLFIGSKLATESNF